MTLPFRVPGAELITNLFDIGDLTIDKIRSIDWAKKHLWSVKFVEPAINDSRFGEFFPASDISFPEFTLESYAFSMGQSSYVIPQSSPRRQMSITFYDTKDHYLLNWIKTWVNVDILNNGQFISCLMDRHEPVVKVPTYGYETVFPCRTIQFEKLDYDLNPIPNTHVTATVYPENEIEFQGSSDSGAIQYTVTFVIVGLNDRIQESPGPSDYVAKAKRIVSQGLRRLI